MAVKSRTALDYDDCDDSLSVEPGMQSVPKNG